MPKATVFNPNFKFEFGAAKESAQAPWDFSGIVKQAVQDQGQNARTTIDTKIQEQLKRQGGKRKEGPVERNAAAESSDESGGDDDDDDEDVPLPGELDDDSNEDASDAEAWADDGDSDDDGGQNNEEEEMDDEDEADEEAIRERAQSFKTASSSKITANTVDPKRSGKATNGGDVPGKAAASEKGVTLKAKGQPMPEPKGQREQKPNSKAKADGEVGGKVNGLVSKQTDSTSTGAEKKTGNLVMDNTGGKKVKGQEPSKDKSKLVEDTKGIKGMKPEASTAGRESTKVKSQLKGSKGQAEGEQGAANGVAAAGEGTKTGGKGRGRSGGFYAETPEGTSFSATSFSDLHLSRPLLKAIAALGYERPTPIQAACIPLVLAGRDICGSAVTGSGKTAAYALPILERLMFRSRQASALYVAILVPTRELAVQVHSMIGKLAQFTDVVAALVVGGLSLQAQSAALRRGAEIVVATPGRLIDHLRNTQSVGLEDLAVLVLDEADRLLEMGFKAELVEVLRSVPRQRQTLLFSATFNSEVRELMTLSLRQPVRLAADAAGAAPRQLSQEVVRLKGAAAQSKEAVMMALCARSLSGGQTIVFFRTKQRAHRAKILFGLAGLPPAAELHGNMTQAARLDSLEKFRTGQVSFLLATDVAARGLDIAGVKSILNYDMPSTVEAYLHRIGRTARAGSSGLSITLVEDADRSLVKEVVKRTRADLRARLVPPAAVSQWQAKIESLSDAVVSIYGEEREEKELRQAEMQANKLQNMLDHEDEISARPARTWFQSEREKRALKHADHTAAAGTGKAGQRGNASGAKRSRDWENQDEGDGGDGRKKQKLKGKKEFVKGADKGKKRENKLEAETGALTAGIRSTKSRIRSLVQEGIAPQKAAKMAAASMAGGNKKKKAKGSGGLFEGAGVPGSQASTPRSKASRSPAEAKLMKRGGKGKSAFKSKKRFKRR